MGLCVDCGGTTAGRGKATVRCWQCYAKRKSKNAKGRVIGVFCKSCNKELSMKKNATGFCSGCVSKNVVPWNKGVKGCIPWNKGLSKFKEENEKRDSRLKHRRERYRNISDKDRLIENTRCLVRNHINGNSSGEKKGKTFELIGCDKAFFISHIESLWSSGMSWGNYGNGAGKWNIDHIRPISLFKNIEDFDVQKEAFNYTNCQPMWSVENIRKGNRVQQK